MGEAADDGNDSLVGITETQSWQRAFQIIAEKSRWDLTDNLVEDHMAMSFQFVMEMLSEVGGMGRRLDPSGEASLGLAKRMRLDVVRNKIPADTASLSGLADEHFGLPSYGLGFWDSSAAQRPWWDRARSSN